MSSCALFTRVTSPYTCRSRLSEERCRANSLQECVDSCVCSLEHAVHSAPPVEVPGGDGALAGHAAPVARQLGHNGAHRAVRVDPVRLARAVQAPARRRQRAQPARREHVRASSSSSSILRVLCMCVLVCGVQAGHVAAARGGRLAGGPVGGEQLVPAGLGARAHGGHGARALHEPARRVRAHRARRGRALALPRLPGHCARRRALLGRLVRHVRDAQAPQAPLYALCPSLPSRLRLCFFTSCSQLLKAFCLNLSERRDSDTHLNGPLSESKINLCSIPRDFYPVFKPVKKSVFAHY